ncbi:hypothetical protein BDY19DRAFT_323691 [Irpex rosettiformis]|uniref:Uncharacterized protein n=1 Tax=Irpex rosettiformis TaxID=378272 RepID=A0ACB8TYG5_9APHY|nr:hypothetical protein BDY19DRAFT_323691 [Irpex rosettiformis]
MYEVTSRPPLSDLMGLRLSFDLSSGAKIAKFCRYVLESPSYIFGYTTTSRIVFEGGGVGRIARCNIAGVLRISTISWGAIESPATTTMHEHFLQKISTSSRRCTGDGRRPRQQGALLSSVRWPANVCFPAFSVHPQASRTLFCTLAIHRKAIFRITYFGTALFRRYT